ncbi:MAG: alpha-N-arabinofuranosidase [Armatimonadetes bacterium]|nr:alpha-N-arabinofuranosidase [Armatimonadota bacterium]
MARLIVQPGRKLGDIHPHIYGQFIEHLGRCIYGGIYDPDSPLSDERGFRTDVLQAVRELKVPILRWPGGNFSSGYHWLDGVGPAEQRRSRPELAWHTTEPNTFGTNEFIEYCRVIETEPYLCLNMGNGTMDEAIAWVEYCNRAEGTYYADLRRQHGYPEPHKVIYWGLGNEIWGDFQIGHKSAADYAWQARDWAKVLKRLDPDIKLVACGGTGNAPSLHWDLEVLERALDFIDYTALHYYWGPRGEDSYFGTLAGTFDFERYLAGVEGLIDNVRRDRKMARPIWISVDEWNVSYHPAFDHEMYYTLRDALADALFLHMLQRHCNTVKMANLAQMVNVIPAIMTSPQGMFRESIYWPLWLERNLAGDTLVDCWADVETWEVDFLPGASFPYLDAVATLDEAGNRLVLSVVNCSPSDDIEAEINLLGVEVKDRAFAHTLNADDADAQNTFETPDRVRTVTGQITGANPMTYTFPAHSLTVIELGLA